MRRWLAIAIGCGGLLLGCGDSKGNGAKDDAGTPGDGDGDTDAGGDGDADGDAGGDGDADGDAGGDGDAPVTGEACFADLEQPEWGRIDVLRLKSEEHGIELWRARKLIDAPTVGETSAYALLRFWVKSEHDAGTCVTNESAFKYTWAHHNWDEVWEATTAHAQYIGNERYGWDAEPTWTDTLTVKDKAGVVLLDSVPLTEDGCYSLPYDLNVCWARTRIDEPPPGWGEE